ncbi:ATPase [Aliikangiella coralliicola]|uniref:ATPase n=2 Tax=Aliikangiella coralliicola TaxID=2592383 RepID=A0A545UHZ9_9GAMM|nr:ATPase [Aliikangiella coralliicola]
MENMLYLGIDGGGSKCRAVIASLEGEIVGRGVGGPANPLHGFQKTLDSILDASLKALEDASLTSAIYSKLIAGVGLAGVNLPGLYKQMTEWQHPFAKMYLTTDLDIANIGAHDGSEGAVIIVGTGSCGFVNSSGHKSIFGGHGFPIGDKASGAWMGLEAIKHTLLALDGFSEQSSLATKVSEYFAVDNALALSEKMAGRSSRQYAKLAKIVFDCADENDPSALAIVNQGIDYITKMANRLLRDNPQRLCMIGGLTDFILPRLSPELAAHFVKPIEQPEIGALHYAEQCWKSVHKQSA